MVLIPGGIRRAPRMRSDLSYAKYARATWDWWCRRHEADFLAIEEPPEGTDYAPVPPTMQRWVVLERLLEERGEGAQVLLVDADTMIRWDAPDIFGQARGFSAVADAGSPAWIVQSTRAFQHLSRHLASLVGVFQLGYHRAGRRSAHARPRTPQPRGDALAAFGQGDDVRKFRHRTDTSEFRREAGERAGPLSSAPLQSHQLLSNGWDAHCDRARAQSRCGTVRREGVCRAADVRFCRVRLHLALHQM